MDKPAGKGMVLTPRDIGILKSVAACGALSGDQIRRHHRFGSVGRTNATLLRLVRGRYLSRRFQPTVVGTRRPIYILDRAGMQLTGETRQTYKGVSDLFLQHQLLVNEVRFAFEDAASPDYAFQRWVPESGLRDMRLNVLPDGFVEYVFGGATFSAFVEVDRGTEGLKRFDEKVRLYLDLAFSGAYLRLFNRRFFRTLVLAPDEGRIEALRELIAARTDKIFWLSSFADLHRDGPLVMRWVRPRSQILHSLTES